jgi:hypothetical protein
MDTAQRIVTQTPLTELWNTDGPLDACRAENLGETDIKRLLRNGSSFVVAEAGQPLRWISEGDRFAFWKTEVKCRLVAPDADGTSTTIQATTAMSQQCGSAPLRQRSLFWKSITRKSVSHSA